MIPGEIRVGPDPIELNVGRERTTLVVVNDGDRPIQVGSHLHFPDCNPALSFDRDAAVGFRLAVPAGTSVRFEPGVSKSVELVRLAGSATVPGIQIRRPDHDMPTYERQPRPVVPFGTPGSLVDEPERATPRGMRISDEPAHVADDSERASSAGPARHDDPSGHDVISGSDADARPQTDTEGGEQS